MIRMMAFLLMAVAMVTAGGAARASGIVLILANQTHDHLRAAPDAARLLPLGARFQAAGFATDQATDLSSAPMRAGLDALAARIARDRPERVVIVFAGYTLHNDSGGAWLMGTETRDPAPFSVDASGVRLETVLAIAGQIQGGAVVAIADLGFPQRPGPGLQPGLPANVAVPQGVSLLRGPPAQLAAVLDTLAQPGTNLRRAVAATRQVRLDGFDPPFLTFLPADHAPAQEADRRAFAAAREQDSIEGWRDYLAAFPQGLFLAEARAALELLENTPDRIEARLNLTRDERRAVQRHLALLGFDPRGIDGIFGPGSRTAIAGWQAREGLAQTGFLDRDQVFRLAAQAARRAAELEEEERRRQAELERRDRAWWRDTGAGQDESGLRAYLDRYPQGIFAAIARERLAEIEARREAERRAQAEARDREAWGQARAADTPQAYRGYLEAYPGGLFADEARARIAAVLPPPEPIPQPLPTPVEIEQALRMPRLTRVLVEQRLAVSGFSPGRVDGVFDRDTRRAIGAFQRGVGLPDTGYLNEATLDLLIPGGLLRLID